MEDFDNNASDERKRKMRKTGNEEVNQLCWEWFKDATSRQIPVSGPILQTKAMEFASSLGVESFKVTNGWLESFRKRHNIKFKLFVGESADVDTSVVAEWMTKVRSIRAGYSDCDIYNLDETGLCFRSRKDKTLYIAGQDCRGGKRSKERITVMLCGNAAGDKERALVIGKSAHPRCFKNIQLSELNVDYRSNRKAWMTSAIFEEWLEKFNRKMAHHNRQVLLFLDNAPCHPAINMSNVTLKFLPPNTTCHCQPMDQGIIQSMKLKYYKQQLSHMIQIMDSDKTIGGSDILKSINLLQAITWLANAWRDVDATTICKCFAKCSLNESPTDESKPALLKSI